MGRLNFIISFLLLSITASAQDTSFRIKLNKPIKGEFRDFTVDNLGNIYLIAITNQVKKLNPNGDSVCVFNDVKRFGKISHVDVTNPLKILVYYKDFSTILILDRFLSVQNTIDLRKQNILQAKAIGLSYDNNIWVFDEMESKIKKIDESGKVLLESADMRQSLDETPSPAAIIDDNKSLYLYDTKLGWFVFDYYGAFRGKYAFTNWKDVQVMNENLIGREDSCIVSSKPKQLSFTKRKCIINLSNASKLQHQFSKTYILFPDRLEIYDAY
jgi:hypothetical protein